MEDAIDDILLSEIHRLRREETIAQGIRWVQDVRFKPKFHWNIVCKLIMIFLMQIKNMTHYV